MSTAMEPREIHQQLALPFRHSSTIETIDGSATAALESTSSIVINLESAANQNHPKQFPNKSLYIIILLALGAVLYFNLTGRIYQPVWNTVMQYQWAKHILFLNILWSILSLLMLAYRTILWFRYRDYLPATHSTAPAMTVIIPAYNEGPMVEKTVNSVAAANYPRDRLEIMVVDDGSRDDTWLHITRAAQRYPGLVTTIRFTKNRGKRAALSTGFRRAHGTVLVTIDSDSVIEKDTLLAIAGPFQDPHVGAVAGRVSVYNRRQGMIPRMLHVCFTLSFDFLRAAESSYRTVYCCPGALTGYRATVVREVLTQWKSQTFLGAACTFGEDRALTNFILAAGYDSVYQRSAVVHTLVPTTYRKLTKMFLRWDRSYVREELRLAHILWKRPPVARITTLFDRTITNLGFPVSYAMLIILLLLIAQHPETLLRLAMGIGTIGLLYSLYFLRIEQSWDFIYGIFYVYFSTIALIWVFPYAVVTVRSRSWLTR